MRPVVTDRVAWSVGLSFAFGLSTRVGPGNHVLDGGPDPIGGAISRGKGRPIVKYRDTLQSSVQKRLNRSRLRLSCQL